MTTPFCLFSTYFEGWNIFYRRGGGGVEGEERGGREREGEGERDVLILTHTHTHRERERERERERVLQPILPTV